MARYVSMVLYIMKLMLTQSKETEVMSFDVRSEKFDLIKGPGGADYPHCCF